MDGRLNRNGMLKRKGTGARKTRHGCIDAVNDLLKTFEVPVIFITAYPERFLTGERPEPAFLIAKPFQPANVSAVISQALFFQQTARRREAKTA